MPLMSYKIYFLSEMQSKYIFENASEVFHDWEKFEAHLKKKSKISK